MYIEKLTDEEIKEIVEPIIEKYNLSQDEYIYIGDDVNDFDSLNYAKYAITVPNAVVKVRELEGVQITSVNGGDGAFREVVDCLLDNI